MFERWCDDERNGVVLAGYTVEGTLAHDLLNHPTEIVCQDNRVKVRRCQIEFISFSAHVDYTQNSAFIRTVRVKVIVIMKIIHQFLMSHMFSSVIFLSTPSLPRLLLQSKMRNEEGDENDTNANRYRNSRGRLSFDNLTSYNFSSSSRFYRIISYLYMENVRV